MSPAKAPTTLRNWLLDRAFGSGESRPVYEIDVASVARNEVLHAPGDPITHVLFPFDCLLSVTQGAPRERGIEIASVGREGLAGLWTAFGVARWPAGCVARIPGRAARVPVDQFQSLLAGHPGFAITLRAYAAAFLQQVGQSTVCLARHSIEEQCARWLALAQDRVGSADLDIGHDTLGEALGARRASVTVTLGLLARAGMIANRRLRVSILDRAALIDRACSCYAATVEAFEAVNPAWAAAGRDHSAERSASPAERESAVLLSERDRRPAGVARAAAISVREEAGRLQARARNE